MEAVKIERIVFVQISLVHYQFPRLSALSVECRKRGIAFSNIELTGFNKEYPWITGSERAGFSNTTLFPGEYLDKIGTKKVWKSLQNVLEESKPDVLFIYGYSLKVMRLAKAWADKRDIATVLMSDSNRFDKRRYWFLEVWKKSFVSRFDGAFVGGTSSSRYVQSLGIPIERVACGLDVIDISFFEQTSTEARSRIDAVRRQWNLPERYFLFVGRLIREKNLQVLLRAYKNYVEFCRKGISPWDLVICGSGPMETEIRNTVQDLPEPVRERIHRFGHINQPEVIDFFTCASCFVLPSISESWGLVINEACASGLPVIVSKTAGCARDLVAQDGNGWVFDPENIDELSDLMVRATSQDETDRNMMGQRGKDLLSEWGLDRYTSEVLSIAEIARIYRKSKNQSSDREPRRIFLMNRVLR
jgi:1,2-diacylglycerol 3-alpha-glucosyltransferase